MHALYRFEQDYTIGKEFVSYRKLFVILRHFKTPLSRVACEIIDDETAVIYYFSSVFDFVSEYHHAVYKLGCIDCGMSNNEPTNPILTDARALRIAARNFIYRTERPKTKTYIVPTLQACLIILVDA